MKRLIVSGLVGGLVVFAWGALSWMALPWHAKTLYQFINEMDMTAVVHAGAKAAGVYLLPHEHRQGYAGPSVLAVVRPQAVSSTDRW